MKYSTKFVLILTATLTLSVGLVCGFAFGLRGIDNVLKSRAKARMELERQQSIEAEQKAKMQREQEESERIRIIEMKAMIDDGSVKLEQLRRTLDVPLNWPEYSSKHWTWVRVRNMGNRITISEVTLKVQAIGKKDEILCETTNKVSVVKETGYGIEVGETADIKGEINLYEPESTKVRSINIILLAFK